MDYASSPYPLLNPPLVSSNIQQPPTLVSLYTDQHKNKNESPSQMKRSGSLLRIAVYATLAFLVLSQGFTYRIVNQIYSSFSNKEFLLVNEEGCPTVVGTIAHTTVFFICMLLLLFTSKA